MSVSVTTPASARCRSSGAVRTSAAIRRVRPRPGAGGCGTALMLRWATQVRVRCGLMKGLVECWTSHASSRETM